MSTIGPDQLEQQTRFPLHLRVFISSPGDVAEERALARQVIERLQYEGGLRGRVFLETVAWDKPGSETPMLATKTPQEAINEGLPRPSECDIVIVILWSRIGTLLPGQFEKPDGSPYLSGTEWEYWDAVQAAEQHDKPEVFVYRRTEVLKIAMDDPEKEEKERQWHLVSEFFESFTNPDGSIARGFNPYATPDAFERLLERHLRDRVHHLLESTEPAVRQAQRPSPSVLPLWKGSPFPGLRAFTLDDAPIYFGRGLETEELVHKLADPDIRFVALVGASGSGKSSLAAAGLLPRLQANAIPGSRDWSWIWFTPGEFEDDPFPVLTAKLAPLLEGRGWRARDIIAELRASPDALAELSQVVLDDRPDWAELLVFIDQFEELFTLVSPEYCDPFIKMLEATVRAERVRVVVTMRADFYHRYVEWAELAALLRVGSYPLAAPKLSALFEMIIKPAERAGLTFENGLVERILEDTGTEPGGLALMAFALSELYETRTADDRLTHAAYEGFDGVQGAIARRAEDTFSKLDTNVQAALSDVFRELVEVDERGVTTRRRTPMVRVSKTDAATTLTEKLIAARLLVSNRGVGGESMIEVAHEALLESWPRLADWIEATREDLRLRRQLGLAAAEWNQHGGASEFLWPDERVVQVIQMMKRLDPDLTEVEKSFLGPTDYDYMLAEIDNPLASHELRATIGVRLALLGDPRPGVGLREDGLPDINWCAVPGGEVALEGVQNKSSPVGHYNFSLFYIAKYPVTWMQYRTFLEAMDGYKDTSWWEGLAHRHEKPGKQYQRRDNHPAESVSWCDAVAFCRWLSARLGYEIRLPAEWEWQQAATGGDSANTYPWGEEWDASRANTYESELSRTTAVGMYPQGASPLKVLDMCGNVWEWCLNEHERPERIDLAGDVMRVVRGGSFIDFPGNVRTVYRLRNLPHVRGFNLGFRVASDSPPV